MRTCQAEPDFSQSCIVMEQDKMDCIGTQETTVSPDGEKKKKSLGLSNIVTCA